MIFCVALISGCGVLVFVLSLVLAIWRTMLLVFSSSSFEFLLVFTWCVVMIG